jgi:hypothetical protein
MLVQNSADVRQMHYTGAVERQSAPNRCKNKQQEFAMALLINDLNPAASWHGSCNSLCITTGLAPRAIFFIAKEE